MNNGPTKNAATAVALCSDNNAVIILNSDNASRDANDTAPSTNRGKMLHSRSHESENPLENATCRWTTPVRIPPLGSPSDAACNIHDSSNNSNNDNNDSNNHNDDNNDNDTNDSNNNSNNDNNDSNDNDNNNDNNDSNNSDDNDCNDKESDGGGGSALRHRQYIYIYIYIYVYIHMYIKYTYIL